MDEHKRFDESQRVPDRLLGPLRHLHFDKDLLVNFFFVFSRFEFALKQAGFLKSIEAGADAEPDWSCFSKRINNTYASNKNAQLTDAVEYVLSHAPKKQSVQLDGSLGWKPNRTTRKDIEWVRIPKARLTFRGWRGDSVVDTYGNIEILFEYMPSCPPFDEIPKRLELLNRLNEIQDVAIPADVITRRPTVPLRVLQDEAVLGQFIVTLGWVVEEIQGS